MVEMHAKARAELFAGARLLADAVKVTLGPGGRCVFLERSGESPLVTKDGASVANEVALRDPLRHCGAALVRRAAARTKEEVGDGSTTATVLAGAMLTEGARFLAVGVQPTALRQGLEAAVADALNTLDRLAMGCESDRELRAVASIASNGDEEVAELAAKAARETGAEGVVRVKEARGSECTLETAAGFSFESRPLALPSQRGGARSVARLEHCRVLVYDGALEDVDTLVPFLQRVARSRSSVLLVVHDTSHGVAELLRANPGVRAYAVCPRRLGEARHGLLQDLAVATGTTIVSPWTEPAFEDIDLNQLGRAAGAEIAGDRTVLMRPRPRLENLEAWLWKLRLAQKRSQDPRTHGDLGERLANLLRRAAVLHVGADSAAELAVRMPAAQDALRAAQAAVREGAVPGGGVALLRCAQALRPLREALSTESAHGVEVAARALAAPFQQIVRNTGLEPRPVQARVLAGTGAYGYDAGAHRYGDLHALGVLDAAAVVKATLRNAVSVAALLLSVDAAVTAGGGE